MKQISPEHLKKAIEKIDSLSDEDLDEVIESFTLEQTDLVGYILQASLEFENEQLGNYSIYYFAVIYEAFKQAGFDIAAVSEEDIDDFQEPFILALDAINKDQDYVPMQDLTEQHHLMNFMINELEEEDTEGVQLDEAMQTQLFLVISGMIGLLNGAIINKQ